uniref:PPM-type phosphatase domain-containing protein n=1 Tax=Lactuca sativa TaxID=4236 RepID=A0A9R1WWU5_LACSA|nr:hypothetical protein LSAT_V11C800450810 [Lactuca sativa]
MALNGKMRAWPPEKREFALRIVTNQGGSASGCLLLFDVDAYNIVSDIRKVVKLRLFVNQLACVELNRGTWMVHGVVVVSWSIGDVHLKDWLLSEPERTILPLTDELEYPILVSDGVWDDVQSWRIGEQGSQRNYDQVNTSMLNKKQNDNAYSSRDPLQRLSLHLSNCSPQYQLKIQKITLIFKYNYIRFPENDICNANPEVSLAFTIYIQR